MKAACPVQAHTAGLVVLAFSPCGQRLASGSEDGVVILWDAQTGKAELVLQAHTECVGGLSFSAHGALLASGSDDGSIHVWDVAMGTLLRTIDHAHGGVVEDDRGHRMSGVHFSPTDSRRLVSVGNKTQLWDAESGAMIRSVEGCYFAVFSPDGRTIATATDDGDDDDARDVLLFDAATGAERLRLGGHHEDVFAVAFSVNPEP